MRPTKKLKADTIQDEQGRQRFHGAFTGGFSAGFYNTVGSVEGFKPTAFVSSRSNRANVQRQTARDLVDDDDGIIGGLGPGLGLFGRLMSSPGKILSRPGSRQGSRQASRQGSLQGNDAEIHQPLAGGASVPPHHDDDVVLSPFPGPLPLPLSTTTTAAPPLESTTNPSVAATTDPTNTTNEKRSKKKKKTKEAGEGHKEIVTEPAPSVPAPVVEDKKKGSGISATPLLSLFGKKENKAAATTTKTASTPSLPPIVPKK